MDGREIRLLSLEDDAATLNSALLAATERYIGFTSVTAHDNAEYFAALVAALEKSDCALASGRLLTTDGKPLMCGADLPNGTGILDTTADPTLALVYPDGILVRTDALQEAGALFDDTLAACRDELFAIQLNGAFPKRLYVPGQTYRAQRTLDDASKRTERCANPAWYWQAALPMRDALASTNGTLSKPAQFGLLYLTMWRLEANIGEDMNLVFADAAETQRYLDTLGLIARSIDDDVLFVRSPRLDWARYKLFYLAKLREPGTLPATRIEARDNDALLLTEDTGEQITSFSEQYLRVQCVRYQENTPQGTGLSIDFVIESLFEPGTYTVEFANRYDGADHAHAATLDTRVGGKCTFFEIEAFSYTSYKVFVPLAPKACKQTISARIRIGEFSMEKEIRVWSAWQTHMYWNSKRSYWSLPGLMARAYGGKIRLEPAGTGKKFVQQLEYLYSLKANKKVPDKIFKWRLLYFLTRPYFKKKRIWAYYDKGFKGGDNAEYAYLYAKDQHDGIEKVYYIDPDSADGKRMAAAGYNTLAPGSTKGILYALNAEVIYMTHVPAFRKMGISKAHIRYFLDLVNPKCIRMYHGFPLTSDLSFTQTYSDYAGVVIGSEYERALYGGPDCGFTPEQIIASGMPRYDGLVDNSQRQLLFAPTWRPILHGGESETGASHYNEHFKESKYYERYNRILTDERLLECARECGYKIKLFLHPRLAVQTPDFEANDVVQPLDCTKDTDYVTIMRESDLMVTDYSSVMYDFAYMRKPLVYYHDPALPYWRSIDFDYGEIGFGEICEDPDALVETLCEYMRSDCALKDFYRGRIERFFVQTDREASRRVYEATRAITG